MPILSEDVIIRLLVDTNKGVADLKKAETGTKNLAKNALKMAAAMGGAALAFELVVKAITAYIQHIKEAEKAAVDFARDGNKALSSHVQAYVDLNAAIEESKRIDGELHLAYMENHRVRRAARIEETNLVKAMTDAQNELWRAENLGKTTLNDDFVSRLEFMQKIIKDQNDYVAALDATRKKAAETAELNRRLNEEEIQAGLVRQEELRTEAKARDDAAQAIQDAKDRLIAGEAEVAVAVLAAEQAKEEARGEAALATATLWREAHDAEMVRIEERKQAALDAASSMYGTLKGIVQQYYDAEIQAAGDNEEKLAVIREKQFKANQAFAIADTIINTASAIMKILSQGGIFAAPLAAAAAALGVAQLAVIASAKPSFATGTPPGGFVVPPGYEDDSFGISAASGETVTVDRPGQGGGQMLYASISIDGYQFGEVMTQLFDSRKATVNQRAIVA